MKSILREYIRAALVLNEADDKYTTSSALISGLRQATAPEMPSNLAGLVVAANKVIENNLSIYLAEAQKEIDNLFTLSVVDMGEEDLASIYRSISALLSADAGVLDETHYPIRTALYLIALDENMPFVFESTSDFLLSIVSQLGEMMPGNSPDIQADTNENRNSAYGTISEGAIWNAITKGAAWLSGNAAIAGKVITAPIAAPGDAGYKKLASAIALKIPKAIDEMQPTFKINAERAIDKAQKSVIARNTALPSADIAYTVDNLALVATDLLQLMAGNSSKTVANLADAEIENVLRARLPTALASLSKDKDVIKYVKEAIRLADAATGGVERFVSNTGPARLTLAAGAAAAAAFGAFATADALKEAGTIAPNEAILKKDFAALVTFEKLAEKGASAAKSVGGKLDNVDVYFSRIDFDALGTTFAKLINYMQFNPFRETTLQPSELKELSGEMSAAIAAVTTQK